MLPSLTGWAVTQTDTAVSAMLDFLETGDSTEVVLEMDACSVLAGLRGEPSRQVVMAVLELLPACTEPQPAFDSGAGYFERDYCLPSNMPMAEVARQTHAVVMEIVGQIPQSREKASVAHLSLLGQDTMVPASRERLQL